MTALAHRTVTANGIRIHLAEAGAGPLVLLCHGSPESWYAWRAQLAALAAAGYRAVAPDMRGYGRSARPDDVGAYTITHLVGDVVGLIGALGETAAVVVGHDWGAPVAWYSALMRPDLVRAVAVLSVPYQPPMTLPPGASVTGHMRRMAGERDYYRLHFQPPGLAEIELEANVRATMLGLLYTLSGDIGPGRQWDGFMPRGSSVPDNLTVPEALPGWLSEEDLDFYVAEFERTGFTGGLNYYRCIDAMPACLAPFVGRTVAQPSLFLCGEFDPIAGNSRKAHGAMREALPDLRGLHSLDGAGHWLQQERPAQVNRLLLEFLDELGPVR